MTDDKKTTVTVKVDVTKEGIVDNDLACGIRIAGIPVETGPGDPSYKVCKVHDLEGDAHTEGLPNNGLLVTTTDFIEGEAKVEVRGLYAVVSAPIYAVLATVVNPFLWVWEGWTKKDPVKPSLVVPEDEK